MLGEYTEVSQDVSRASRAGSARRHVDTNAWQLAVSWFLTGEEEAFRGFKPKARFSPSEGTWGAFEIRPACTSSTSTTTPSAAAPTRSPTRRVSASKAGSYGVGLNWYLNENVKWLLNYELTTLRRRRRRRR